MSRDELELRFVGRPVEDYLRVFEEQYSQGKRSFLLHPVTQEAVELLRQVQPQLRDESLKVYGIANQVPRSQVEGVSWDFQMGDIDVVMLFPTDAQHLSQLLMRYASLEQGIVCAPVTEHHWDKRPVLVNSIPKGGTHMLFACLHSFGYRPAPSLDLPSMDAAFSPGHYYSLQHMTTDYLAQPLPRSISFVAGLCRSAILFIYRDPRDIAVSMAHYLAAEKAYHILHHCFNKISPEERLARVIEGRYPIPIFVNRRQTFSGNIRELAMMFADWVLEPWPNVMCVRFEDLVGPRGGGNADLQRQTVWKIQLALHVPGAPSEFADNVFSPSAATFRRGQIGSHVEAFGQRHYNLFNSLDQDFMELLGYAPGAEVPPGMCDFTGSIPIQEPKGPALIESSYEGYNVVYLNGEYLALNQRVGSTDLTQVDRDGLLKAKGVFHGSSPADLKFQIDQERNDVTRARRNVRQLRTGPVIIEEGYRGYNLIYMNGECLALAQHHGSIDLAKANLDRLVEDKGLLRGTSKEDLRFQIDKVRSLELRARGIDRDRGVPILVEEGYRGFNLVYFDDEYYALDRNLGEIDLAQANRDALVAGEGAFRGHSPDALHAQIDEALGAAEEGAPGGSARRLRSVLWSRVRRILRRNR